MTTSQTNQPLIFYIMLPDGAGRSPYQLTKLGTTMLHTTLLSLFNYIGITQKEYEKYLTIFKLAGYEAGIHYLHEQYKPTD